MQNLLGSDHFELDSIFDELLASFSNSEAAQIFSKLDYFWARLAMHIRAENLHLFPSIREALETDAPDHAKDLKISAEFVRDTLRQLERDHNFFMRELGDAVKQMRARREDNRRDEGGELDDLREKIRSLHRRLARHNELEEKFIYSLAEKLDPEAAAELRSKIQKELTNLPPRLREAN